MNGFIVGGLALIGTLTLLIAVKPDAKEEGKRNHIVDSDSAVLTPNTNTESREEEKVNNTDNTIGSISKPENNVIDVSGVWYDEEGSQINIEQNGVAIRFSMVTNPEQGVAVEMSGSGIMNDQAVHLELGGQVLGMITPDRVPVDITFANSRKATLTMNMGEMLISSSLHR